MFKIFTLFIFIYNIICEEFPMTINIYKNNGNYKSDYLRNLQYSTPIYGNTSILNYYYVNIYIGNPPKRQAVIIDTGSLLTTIPCMPHCESCGKHINSYYNISGIFIFLLRIIKCFRDKLFY